MATKVDGVFTLSHGAPIAFHALFTPKVYQENGKDVPNAIPYYDVTLLMLPTNPDWPLIRAHAAKIAQATFGTVQDVNWPFSRGDEVADKGKAKGYDNEWMRGGLLLQARSQFQPRLAIVDGARKIDLVTDAQKQMGRDKFFTGAECLALLNFYAKTKGGVRRVNCYINAIMATGDGERHGGGDSRPASEVFSGYRGGVSQEDPTKGLSGDGIPF